MRQHGKRRGHYRAIRTLCSVLAAVWSFASSWTASGADVPWSELRAVELRLRDVRQERAVAQEALAAFSEHTGWWRNKAVKEARQRLADAEAAYRSLLATGELADLRKQREDAGRKCREIVESEVVGDEPAYAALVAALGKAEAERDTLDGRRRLKPGDAKKLASLRVKVNKLTYVRDMQIVALRTHDAAKEASREYASCDSRWKGAHGKGKPAGGALAALEAARSNLRTVYEAELAGKNEGKVLLAECDALAREQSELETRLAALTKASFGDRGAWKMVEAAFDLPPGKDGKTVGAVKVRLWHLPDVKAIRGLIVRALDHPLLLMAAADCDMAFVDVRAPRGVDIIEGEPSCFDRALAKAAEASGHPEVAYLPFLSKGTSAGVLFARNMGFRKPHRCIGVVHHAGGNLHHSRRSPPRWMPHVPFLAINGEFERYGPEGGGHSSGIHGIRGTYGKQTQWVMCREQLLRMRRRDPNHLISLVVQPRGDHATWDDEMWWITAMFVRKAAKARIPVMQKLPATDVRCVPLKASDGWLSDSRLDHPRHPHAAYADYKGDRIEAFWHLDREMADAVAAYHKDEFYLPDLSLKHPVDPGWGLVK